MNILILASSDPYSRKRFVEAGKQLGHKVTCATMTDLNFVVTPKRTTITVGTTPLTTFDVVALRRFYPTYISEGLFLAEYATQHHIRLVDRAIATKNFIYNKLYNAWRLAKAGLPVTDATQTMQLKNAQKLLRTSKFPLVLKGIHGSQGRFVYKIENAKKAKQSLTKDVVGMFFFQPFMKIDHEYRVIVIGGHAIGAMEKIAPQNDFRHNIAVGSVGQSATLSRNLLSICEKAAKTLGFEFAGIDLAIVDRKPIILEANRCPAFEGFEKATGIDVASVFINHITKTS
jgi:RimK family alpha-L-glutamate ligase